MDTPDRSTSSDWMYGPATLHARAALVAELVAMPQISSARVTCDAAPLLIEGELVDGRPYLFRARWSSAALTIANVGTVGTGGAIGTFGASSIDSTATTMTTPCSQDIATESSAETVALFIILLAFHDL